MIEAMSNHGGGESKGQFGSGVQEFGFNKTPFGSQATNSRKKLNLIHTFSCCWDKSAPSLDWLERSLLSQCEEVARIYTGMPVYTGILAKSPVFL